MSPGVVIAGGGLSGVRTAFALRELGWDGPLSLFCEERELPYDRPPLSKAFLQYAQEDDAIRLATFGEYRDLRIDVNLGRPASSVDLETRTLTLEGGARIPYSHLVIATGARPRQLSAFNGVSGVHYLRTLSDARSLRAELEPATRVTVVGGGLIGLEVAASAMMRGAAATVVEALPQPLFGVLGPKLGCIVREWHEEHGARFRCGVPVASVVAPAGRVEAVDLADGSSLPTDVCVVGIGIVRNVEWLEQSGLAIHRGVRCDPDGRTSDPFVYAVGDVACPHLGSQCFAAEHWTAATEQALRVAAAIVGKPRRLEPTVGYFWSDQYGIRLQFAGEAGPASTISIESGSVEKRKFVALCRSGGRVTGTFGMNSVGPFVRSRRRIALEAVSPPRATSLQSVRQDGK